MDRNFFIPIAVATAAHSLIFLPADRPTPPTRDLSPPADVEPWEVVPIDLIDTSDPFTDPDARSETPHTDPMPISAENLTLLPDPDKFIQPGKLDELRPPAPGGDVVKVDPNWPNHSRGPGGGRTLTYTPDLLDNTPAARFQPSPTYPRELKPLAMEGRVAVVFSVDVNGEVFNAQVVSANHSRFGEEALRAVRKWRFEPGIKDGRRVPFRMAQSFTFTLGD